MNTISIPQTNYRRNTPALRRAYCQMPELGERRFPGGRLYYVFDPDCPDGLLVRRYGMAHLLHTESPVVSLNLDGWDTAQARALCELLPDTRDCRYVERDEEFERHAEWRVRLTAETWDNFWLWMRIWQIGFEPDTAAWFRVVCASINKPLSFVAGRAAA